MKALEMRGGEKMEGFNEEVGDCWKEWVMERMVNRSKVITAWQPRNRHTADRAFQESVYDTFTDNAHHSAHTNCFSGKKWRYLWVSNLFLRVMLILVTSVLRRLRQSLLTINTFSHETVTGDVVHEVFIYYSQDDKTRRALKTDIIAETKKRQSYQDCWRSIFHRLVPAADYRTVKAPTFDYNPIDIAPCHYDSSSKGWAQPHGHRPSH